jgi:hypothetical protein
MFLAGIGHEVAQMAAAGHFDDDLQNVVPQVPDFNVMLSGGSLLDRLVAQAPLDYFDAWNARGRSGYDQPRSARKRRRARSICDLCLEWLWNAPLRGSQRSVQTSVRTGRPGRRSSPR